MRADGRAVVVQPHHVHMPIPVVVSGLHVQHGRGWCHLLEQTTFWQETGLQGSGSGVRVRGVRGVRSVAKRRLSCVTDFAEFKATGV